MNATLLILTMLMAPAQCSPYNAEYGPRPTDDALQACAWDVLTGKYDPVPAWKLDLYRKVWQECIKADRPAKRTTYCPRCSGTNCCDSSPVRRGVCAASKDIPLHSVIWLEGDGFLLVCDRGGAVRKRGDRSHFDVWLPSCAGDCWTGPGTKPKQSWALIIRGDNKQGRNPDRKPINAVEKALQRK